MANQAPFPYEPRATATPCKAVGNVEAGDWVQFFVGWPEALSGRGLAVEYKPGRFLVHMLYTPNSDEAKGHEDQSTTFGGSALGETANRRREYRIDPGWMWQAPFNGQLSLIAGGDSPAGVVVPVLIVKGFHPRIWLRQQAVLEPGGAMHNALASTCGDPAEWLRSLACLGDLDQSGLARGPRAFAPPVVGTPQLAPCTFVDVLASTDPAAVPLPFPDGAVAAESGELVRLTTTVLGNTLALVLPAGHRRAIGPMGQGGQVTPSVPATWSANSALATLTFWSVVGG